MKMKTFSSIQAAIQGGIFLFVGILFSIIGMYLNFNVDGKVSALAMTGYIIMTGFWAGVIGGLSGGNISRMDWLKGNIKFTPEEEAKMKKAKPPISPMWLIPLVYGTMQLLLVAVLSAGLCFGLFPDGLPLYAIIPISAILIGGHAAVAAKVMSTHLLYRYVNNPRPEPVPFKSNVVREHLISNVLANIFINGALGFALYHLVYMNPDKPLPLLLMIGDIVVTSFFVSILVPAGTSMQAESEAKEKWTVAPDRGGKPLPGLIAQNLRYILVSECIGALFIVSFFVMGIKSFSIWPIVVIKSIHPAICGGAVAVMAAYWGAARGSQKK